MKSNLWRDVRLKRRTFLRRTSYSILGIIGALTGTYAYAYYIEPKMVFNNKQKILSKKIPKQFDSFKIVQFSDTHLGFQYTLEQFHELVVKINKQKPNLVVFTGDLIDEPRSFTHRQQLITTLSEIRATHGKYWVYGNHDHGDYGTDIIREIMEEANFKLLKNHTTKIKHEETYINLSGLDDAMLGKPNFKKTLENIKDDEFTILLAHEPDIADFVQSYNIDVQLSGHSHGGQVRLPFIGHLYTPTYAEKYVQGKYNLPKNNMKLFVSRGIGTTRLPFRLFCKPEFHTFTLYHNNV